MSVVVTYRKCIIAVLRHFITEIRNNDKVHILLTNHDVISKWGFEQNRNEPNTKDLCLTDIYLSKAIKLPERNTNMQI